MKNNIQPFTVRPSKENEQVISKQKNKSGFVNKCIKFYTLAEVNPRMTVAQLMKEVER